MVQRISAPSTGPTGSTPGYTVLAYAKAHGLRTDSAYVQRLGRRAAALCRENGITPGKAEHPLYVTVNVYPEATLAAAALLIKPRG
jgi:hypothetical protein